MADSLAVTVDGNGVPTQLVLTVNDPVSIGYFNTVLMPRTPGLTYAQTIAGINGNLLDPADPSDLGSRQRTAVLATARAALRSAR